MNQENGLSFITTAFGYLVYRNSEGFLEMWKRKGERKLKAQEIDNAERDLIRIITRCTEVNELKRPKKKKKIKYRDDNQLKIE